jgi:hypothetical protein
VIVEIDGATHSTDAEIDHDEKRTAHLEHAGYRIFRAWNGDVYENIDGVLTALWPCWTQRASKTKERSQPCPSPWPSPREGGERGRVGHAPCLTLEVSYGSLPPNTDLVSAAVIHLRHQPSPALLPSTYPRRLPPPLSSPHPIP